MSVFHMVLLSMILNVAHIRALLNGLGQVLLIDVLGPSGKGAQGTLRCVVDGAHGSLFVAPGVIAIAQGASFGRDLNCQVLRWVRDVP